MTTKIIVLFFCFSLGFHLLIVSATETRQEPKVYTFNFTDIKSLTNLVIPEKYKNFWDDIIQAKKEGKTSEEIISMTKSKHGIDIDSYDFVLKKIGISKTLFSFVKDCLLNKKPVFELLFKGATTPPKGSTQYSDAIEAVLPSLFKALKPYKDMFRLKPRLYGGGILGDEPDYIRKMKLGEIQFAGGSIAMGEMVAPAICIFDLPFLFDYEPIKYYDECKYCQIDWILDKAAPTLNILLEEKGFVLMGLADGGGYECIVTQKAPITKVEDLADYTFFVFPQSRIAGEINKAMGFKKSVVCKPWDLPSFAASGVLDSLLCCWYWNVLLQTTPYFKYVTDYPLRGFIAAIVLVRQQTFINLVQLGRRFGPMMGMENDEMLTIVRKLISTISTGVKTVLRRGLRMKEGEARRRIIKAGIYKMVKFPPSEIEKMKMRILPLYDKLADRKGTYPKWFMDEILKYRAEYRKFKKQGKLTSKWYDHCIFPDGYDPYQWSMSWGK